MAKKWRSAVVGVGVVGEMHVRLLSQLPTAELVAVCDTKPERAREALAKHKLEKIPVYESVGKLIKGEKLDVVHMATPSGDHVNPCVAAMEAGLNVICEKPLEIQLDRIDKMIEVAAKKKVRLAGIFQNRWNDANRALKSAAEAGRFGTLSYAGCYTPWYRTDQYYRDGGWRGTRKLDGGGAIMNQSVHNIDLLQWIAGPVKRVSAYGASRIHKEIEVEDTLTCSLQFQSGAFGVIMGTTALYPGMPVRIEIGGADGSAVSENGLKFFKFRDERPEDLALLETLGGSTKGKSGGGAYNAADIGQDLHARNMMAIHQAWDENRDAETAGPEARKAVAIILAMYESVKRKGEGVDVR